MPEEAYYAIVPFVRDASGGLSALAPLAAPTRYQAFRIACFSIGAVEDGKQVLGAAVFIRERGDDGELGDLAVIARYGDTPV